MIHLLCITKSLHVEKTLQILLHLNLDCMFIYLDVLTLIFASSKSALSLLVSDNITERIPTETFVIIKVKSSSSRSTSITWENLAWCEFGCLEEATTATTHLQWNFQTSSCDFTVTMKIVSVRILSAMWQPLQPCRGYQLRLFTDFQILL